MPLLKIHEQAIEVGYLKLDLVELEGDRSNPYFFPEQLCQALRGNWTNDKRSIEGNPRLSEFYRIVSTYDYETGLERDRIVIPMSLLDNWALHLPMVYPELYSYLVS